MEYSIFHALNSVYYDPVMLPNHLHHPTSNPTNTMSGDTKVADAVSNLRSRVPMNRASFMGFYDWYHAKYFKTGRFTPVIHAMFVVGTIGYAIDYPHIKHEIEQAKIDANKV